MSTALTIDAALIACLPPASYDPFAPNVVAEMITIAAPLQDGVDSAAVLLAQHQPDQAANALADWERNYALPDDPAQAPGTLTERRAALLARINQSGNLSRQHMIDLAAVVGFPGATVLEHMAMTCADPCDSSVMDDEWIGVWRLQAPAGYTGNAAVLRRLIARRKPAHTIAYITLG